MRKNDNFSFSQFVEQQQKPYGLTLFKSPFKVLKQSIKVVYYLTLLFWKWKNEGNLPGEKKVTTSTNNGVLPQNHHFQVLKIKIDSKVIFCAGILNWANHSDIFPKTLKKQNKECCQIPDLFNSQFFVLTLERWYCRLTFINFQFTKLSDRRTSKAPEWEFLILTICEMRKFGIGLTKSVLPLNVLQNVFKLLLQQRNTVLTLKTL